MPNHTIDSMNWLSPERLFDAVIPRPPVPAVTKETLKN